MFTHITFVLDSSGSMTAVEEDTKGGYNTFLADQRDEDGEATVSLYDFNTGVNRVYIGRRIEDAPELTDTNYSPGGMTALHDAIITAIDETEDYLNTHIEEPENVILVVLTDGRENASETPADAVRERIEDRQDDGWEILFIGANQDAALTAGGMGIDSTHARDMDHSGEGIRDAYEVTSRTVAHTRRTGRSDGFRTTDTDSGDSE